MSSLSAIFFDLDGTLVDSSIGIHNGFTYTFEQLGVPSPDAKTIRGFMGPPLETSFASCLPTEQIESAIQLYRSYYKEKESTKLSSFDKSRNYSLNYLNNILSISRQQKILRQQSI